LPCWTDRKVYLIVLTNRLVQEKKMFQ